jgi:hypothetical protein
LFSFVTGLQIQSDGTELRDKLVIGMLYEGTLAGREIKKVRLTKTPENNTVVLLQIYCSDFLLHKEYR